MCAPDLICSVEADVHSDDVIEVWRDSVGIIAACSLHASSGAWAQ